MNCPLKMFGKSSSNFSCEPYCAFKIEGSTCLLADGLKTYIGIHKPVKVEIEPEQKKKEEISKLADVLSKIPLSEYYGIEDFKGFV